MIDSQKSLYVAFYAAMVFYARGLVGEKQDAEDIVQDVFFVFFEKPEIMGEIKSHKAYLYKAVFNRCMNYIEARRRAKYVDDIELLNACDDVTPESILIWQEREDELKEAIEKLDGNQRKAIELRLEGLSYAEIAEKLHICTGSVGQHISRATRKLQEYFGTTQKKSTSIQKKVAYSVEYITFAASNN